MTERTSELGFELIESGRHTVLHEQKRIYDRHKFGPPAFFKCYLRDDIGFRLKCGVWASENDFENFHAFSSHSFGSGIAEANDGSPRNDIKRPCDLFVSPERDPIP